MTNRERLLWLAIVVLATCQGMQIAHTLRTSEALKAHSDLIDRQGLISTVRRGEDRAGLTALESRIKRLETRLASRRIGDAP